MRFQIHTDNDKIMKMMGPRLSKIKKKENQSFLNLLNSMTEPSDDIDGRVPMLIFSISVDLLLFLQIEQC